MRRWLPIDTNELIERHRLFKKAHRMRAATELNLGRAEEDWSTSLRVEGLNIPDLE